MRGDEMCGNTIGMRRDVPGNARKIAKAARKIRAADFFKRELKRINLFFAKTRRFHNNSYRDTLLLETFSHFTSLLQFAFSESRFATFSFAFCKALSFPLSKTFCTTFDETRFTSFCETSCMAFFLAFGKSDFMFCHQVRHVLYLAVE